MNPNPYPPSFNPPVITIGWSPVATASLSPVGVFHHPLPGWPEWDPEDGFATYARKIALSETDLIPQGAKITLDESVRGADAFMAAVLLVLRQQHAFHGKVKERSGPIASELALLTRAGNLSWKPGCRLDGANLDTSPEVIGLAHKASTDACLTLLLEQWPQFLYQILGPTVTALLDLPANLDRDGAVSVLQKNFPPARQDMTLPTGMVLVDDLICTGPEPDTRFRPVVILDGWILIHPGWFRADRNHQMALEVLAPIARKLSGEERAVGSNAAWVASAGPIGIYRNRSGSPQIDPDRFLQLVQTEIHSI